MQHILYAGHKRPLIEVLVDGHWYPGELRMWLEREGSWTANVNWSRRPGETFVDTVAADRVRPGPLPAATADATPTR